MPATLRPCSRSPLILPLPPASAEITADPLPEAVNKVELDVSATLSS